MPIDRSRGRDDLVSMATTPSIAIEELRNLNSPGILRIAT
jgi:hypothetical protein